MYRIIARIILATSEEPTWMDRVKYILSGVATIAPFAFLINVLTWWATDNEVFAYSFWGALLINTIVGAVRHWETGTFNLWDCMVKTLLTMFVMFSLYAMFEMIRYSIGESFVGDVFRSTIQAMTLLYPTSKVAKNIFLLTKGKYPPSFLMKKLYDFDKSGDLGQLFGVTKDKKKTDDNDLFV